MKRIAVIMLATVLSLSQIIPMRANAVEVGSGEEISPIVLQEEKQPRFAWNDTVTLYTSSWSNLTSYNNLFPDSPTVTNHVNNPGPIIVRVYSSKGAVIGSEKTIQPGESVVLDRIPAFSGSCSFQAKAVNYNGTYSIDID